MWVPTLLHGSGEPFWAKAAQNRKDMVPNKEAITLLEAQVNEAVIRKLVDSIPIPELSAKKEAKGAKKPDKRHVNIRGIPLPIPILRNRLPPS